MFVERIHQIKIVGFNREILNTGEGLASFEKLEKPARRHQREDSLTSLEVCYLLQWKQIVVDY